MRKKDICGPKTPSERQIERVAANQLHLITTVQLLDAGLAQREIGRRASRGFLRRLHHGVYATHPPPYSREQNWLAAVLACGPGALLMGLPAAAQWTLIDHPPLTAHVSVPNWRGRTRKGIKVRRRLIDPRDVRRKNSIPCTSVDLVLIDLAPSHTEAELEMMLVAAESIHLLKRGRLAELIASHRGRPGVHRLERILRLEPAITRSQQEIDFLPICRLAGVDRPKVNFSVPVPSQRKPLEVDFAWPDIRMVVEADSQRFHGDWERAEADRERDQQLALAGWVCHRFVRRKLVNDADGSAEQLRLLVDARVAELAGSSGGVSSASS